jgi:hypothetical protein
MPTGVTSSSRKPAGLNAACAARLIGSRVDHGHRAAQFVGHPHLGAVRRDREAARPVADTTIGDRSLMARGVDHVNQVGDFRGDIQPAAVRAELDAFGFFADSISVIVLRPRRSMTDTLASSSFDTYSRLPSRRKVEHLRIVADRNAVRDFQRGDVDHVDTVVVAGDHVKRLAVRAKPHVAWPLTGRNRLYDRQRAAVEDHHRIVLFAADKQSPARCGTGCRKPRGQQCCDDCRCKISS